MIDDAYSILAIETSLDDTCAAVVRGRRVLSNVIASQTAFHAEYGGTVPHIAKRKHLEWITPAITEALTRARHLISDIDAIGVTYGPGLAPSLEVGIAEAKVLASRYSLPLIAVNHMEGHLLSAFACNSNGRGPLADSNPPFPALGFLLSGGHTMLVLMHDFGNYELLGETLDDACGEAYDKVARMLDLGYPGGPLLSELAKQGTPRFDLPEPMIHRADLMFSFSGLKTAALYELKHHPKPYNKTFCADFAASFEDAVTRMLSRRLKRALERYQVNFLLLGGGVVSNLRIRAMARGLAKSSNIPTFIPYSSRLYTDNAAMIGVCAWYQALRGDFWNLEELLDRKPNLSFTPVS